MSTPVDLTPTRLREWPLPSGADSKYGRGQVLIVGGAARTPGAARLAGLAALRVGAGHLTIAVAEAAAIPLAVVTAEAGVVGLPQNARGSVRGGDVSAILDDLGSADVVAVGPGLDDADETVALLKSIIPELSEQGWLVLDAYALGVLPRVGADLDPVRGRLVLTPNADEASWLLEREIDSLTSDDAIEIAKRYDAVVSCRGFVADPDGRCWLVGSGHGGLATSGSGDVLAGAVTGLLARGAEPAQAACWASYLHAASGDRLAVAVGALGFLASELLDELPRVLVELQA